jgi:tRNA threonylcarbamoyladenosine biosynthesis protein TsaB
MSDPIVLGIETSGILCSVAWWHNDNILLEYNLERKNEHAVILAGLVEKGFSKLGIDPKQTAYVTIGSGPGSFTGLRIGMSYAKGFCYGHDIPLIPVTNFEMLADLSDENTYPVYTLIEAGKGNYYTGLFNEDKKRLDDTKVYSVSQLEEIISDSSVIVVNEENSKGYFTEVFENTVRIIDGHYSAAKLCALGYYKSLQGNPTDISEIEPFYLQAFAGIL